MKTTRRFDRAIKRLYSAFHEGELEAQSCRACAVGNILGNRHWRSHYYNEGDRISFNGSDSYFVYPCHAYHEKQQKEYESCLKNSGYSEKELGLVEKIFLDIHVEHGIDDHALDFISENVPSNFKTKRKAINYIRDVQFEALCAVVEYLASIDNISNPMDYSKAFERVNSKPKYALNEIFV